MDSSMVYVIEHLQTGHEVFLLSHGSMHWTKWPSRDTKRNSESDEWGLWKQKIKIMNFKRGGSGYIFMKFMQAREMANGLPNGWAFQTNCTCFLVICLFDTENRVISGINIAVTSVIHEGNGKMKWQLQLTCTTDSGKLFIRFDDAPACWWLCSSSANNIS